MAPVRPEQQQGCPGGQTGGVALSEAPEDLPRAVGEHGGDPRLRPMRSQNAVKVSAILVVLGMVLATMVALLALFG